MAYQERGHDGVRRGTARGADLQRRHPGERRLLHPARGRDPRPGRADGQRPHRAGPGAVRHRRAQLRRDHSSGAPGRPVQPRDGHRRRHRADPGGPPAQGLVLDHSVRDNLLLPLLGQVQHGRPVSNKAKGRSLSDDLIKQFTVKVAHPDRPVRLLSGGNQQKVVIAKWLGTDPDVLIMDEPTAGVDIGTKTEILDDDPRARRRRQGRHRHLLRVPRTARGQRPRPRAAGRGGRRGDRRAATSPTKNPSSSPSKESEP